MRRMSLMLALCALGLTIGAPARGDTVNRDLDVSSKAAWNGLKGPYAAAIFRHAQRMTMTCDTSMDQCSLGRLAYKIDVYATPGARPQRVVAFVYHSSGGGNFTQYEALYFERAGEAYEFRRPLSELLGTPRSAIFAGATVKLTMETPKYQDARCCPTGRTVYKVDLETGQAHYESGNRIGSAEPVAPPPPTRAAKRVSLPDGAALDEIPAAFRGQWGNRESCAASRRGETGENVPFRVEARSFGDYGASCDIRKVNQASPETIAILAECGEEGGLDEGDDGMRVVTMRLSGPKELTTRFQNETMRSDVGMEFQDHTSRLPACP